MEPSAQLTPENGSLEVPTHVAIIMDGNGRWAQTRGLPRAAGHRKGVEAVRAAVKGALKTGVQYLTLYAFSSENWSRPQDEVNDLMGLLRLYLQKEIASLCEEGVRLRIIGRRDKLASDIITLIEKAESDTAANTKLTLTIALNYGARQEIVDTAKLIAQKVSEGVISLDDIDEELFGVNLTTAGLPDPDLLIRTSGELRLSNFLLWQLAYAELCFLDIYWPDFSEDVFVNTIADYQSRDRRFGGRP